MNFTPEDIKKLKDGNGYVSQKLNYDNRRPFNLGLHSQNENTSPMKQQMGAVTDTTMATPVVGNVPKLPPTPAYFLDNSPFKQDDKATYNTSMEEHTKENPYWYKVNGNRVSKHVYNKYQNKPGGDEIGKQTNDPDASGNKAKIAKDRANITKTPLDFSSPLEFEFAKNNKNKTQTKSSTWDGLGKTNTAKPKFNKPKGLNKKIVNTVVNTIVPDNAVEALVGIGGVGAVKHLKNITSKLYQSVKTAKNLKSTT